MTSFGEQLKMQNKAREEARKELASKKDTDKKRKEQRERRIITHFFSDLMEDTFDAIQLGIEPPVVKLIHYDGPWTIYKSAARTVFVTDKDHPYNDVYLDWHHRAAINGLTFHFEDEHDGYGNESWKNVSMKPRNNIG